MHNFSNGLSLNIQKIDKENYQSQNRVVMSARGAKSSVLVIPRMKSINSKLPQAADRKKFRQNNKGSYILVNTKTGLVSSRTQKELKPFDFESKARTQELSSSLSEINNETQ